VRQLARHRDATAGEGMFPTSRRRGAVADKHQTRLIRERLGPGARCGGRPLGWCSGDNGQPLLQAWAVVSNVSGDNWDSSHTRADLGAPLAFATELPRRRCGASEPDAERQFTNPAQVAFGEAT